MVTVGLTFSYPKNTWLLWKRFLINGYFYLISFFVFSYLVSGISLNHKKLNIICFAFKSETFCTEQNLIILSYFKDILKKLFLGNFIKTYLVL